MERRARVKEREKVGIIEGTMIGEGMRETEREETRGRESEIVIDGIERRKGDGLVLDRGAGIGITIAVTNILEAGTDLEKDITDISTINYKLSQLFNDVYTLHDIVY